MRELTSQKNKFDKIIFKMKISEILFGKKDFVWWGEGNSHKFEHEFTDLCSSSPDIILDFHFCEACAFHDYAYRRRPILGYGNIEWRIVADWLMYKKIRRVVKRDSYNFLHRIIGELICILYFVGIRITAWPAWWKRRL